MAKLYEHHLIDWVQGFIERFELVKSSDHVLVGLSGGMDSMLLGHICTRLVARGMFKSVRFLHVDHGLRPTSSQQKEQICQWCEEMGWSLGVESLSGDHVRTNVEMWARQERARVFTQELQRLDKSVLFLGHHIDDSFEWFMRQLLDSSRVPQGYGIPVKNGAKRRPLHCLSRKHVEFWVSKLNVPYVHDESNDDLAFQRNHIRHGLKSEALKIFPKALAHFVEHANHWSASRGDCQVTYPHRGVCYLESRRSQGDFRGFDQLIMNIIKKLSSSERGELRQNVKKLIAAQLKGRRGPLFFSGGVRAYTYPGLIVFHNNLGDDYLKSRDTACARLVKEAQIPDCHPFVISEQKSFGLKTLKKDKLFSQLVSAVREKDWWIRPKAHVEMTKKNSLSS